MALGDKMKLEDLLAYRLAVSADNVSRQLAQIYEKKFHLARDEWRLLAMLGESGTASSLEAAASTTMDKVQVCRAANRLEFKGLLTREVLLDDKRLRVFTLTDEGQELFKQMVPEILAQNAKMIALLDIGEVENLNVALAKLSVSDG